MEAGRSRLIVSLRARRFRFFQQNSRTILNTLVLRSKPLSHQHRFRGRIGFPKMMRLTDADATASNRRHLRHWMSMSIVRKRSMDDGTPLECTFDTYTILFVFCCVCLTVGNASDTHKVRRSARLFSHFSVGAAIMIDTAPHCSLRSATTPT